MQYILQCSEASGLIMSEEINIIFGPQGKVGCTSTLGASAWAKRPKKMLKETSLVLASLMDLWDQGRMTKNMGKIQKKT